MHTTKIGSLLLLCSLSIACAADEPTDDLILRASEEETTALMVANELRVQYPTIADALAGGYQEASPCLEGLGAHYVDFENFMDDQIDLMNPETLRYAPNDVGEMKLIAVEYSSTTLYPKPPPLLGQEWDGPASTGIPGIPPIWFVTISVRNNPDGIFELYNPMVACRGTGVALGFAPCPDDPSVQCLVPSTCEDLGLTACVEWEQSQP